MVFGAGSVSGFFEAHSYFGTKLNQSKPNTRSAAREAATGKLVKKIDMALSITQKGRYKAQNQSSIPEKRDRLWQAA